MRFIYNLLRYKLYKSTLRNRRYFSTANSSLINVTFITNDDQVEVTIPTGTSILEAAHQNNIELEGACDGCMACSTCHVILDEEVYDSLPEPSESELDMLDLAPCLTPTSRLGCQVILNEEHNGIKVQLPKITRNFYVDGYTPQPH